MLGAITQQPMRPAQTVGSPPDAAALHQGSASARIIRQPNGRGYDENKLPNYGGSRTEPVQRVLPHRPWSRVARSMSS
jgi:hypothetical protein